MWVLHSFVLREMLPAVVPPSLNQDKCTIHNAQSIECVPVLGFRYLNVNNTCTHSATQIGICILTWIKITCEHGP